MTNSMQIEQSGWRGTRGVSVVADYKIVPTLSTYETGAYGRLEFKGSNSVSELCFNYSPLDFLSEGKSKYETVKYNFFDICGQAIDKPNLEFSNEVPIEPKLNQFGWEFFFSSGTFRFGKNEYFLSAEKILETMLCTDSFQVKFGRQKIDNLGKMSSIIEKIVEFRDLDGLRLAVADAFGHDYLKLLMRRQGYHIGGN